MKKVIILALTIMSVLGFTFINSKKINASTKTTIETVDVSIVKDSTTIIINHETNYNYNAAIFEYSYYENGKLYSKLLESQVKNDKFNIPDNSVSIKLHQLKYQKGNLIYRVGVKSNNTIGSFDNVIRIELTEVEFIKAKKRSIAWGGHVGSGGSVFEFYFNFNKNHDVINKIEVDYIIIKNTFLWFTTEKNINKWINRNDEIYYQFGDNLKALDKNTDNSIKADYVVRIEPHTDFSKADLKNFAIIKVEYIVDGEFFIDNTVHYPISIYDDSFHNAMEWFLSFVEKIQNNINSFINFIKKNSTNLLIAIVIIAVLILLSILSPFIRVFFFIIKVILFGLKMLLKLLFLPLILLISSLSKESNNKKENYYKDLKKKYENY